LTQKRDKIMSVALLVILGVSCLYVLSGKEDTSKVRSSLVDWTWNDYGMALEKARTEDKYILIDFWAVWCKECKEMDKKAFQNPDVVELLTNFVLLKVDVDDVPELKAHFAVGGMPTILVVNAEGEEIARVVGYQNAEQMKRFLEEVIHGQG